MYRDALPVSHRLSVTELGLETRPALNFTPQMPLLKSPYLGPLWQLFAADIFPQMRPS